MREQKRESSDVVMVDGTCCALQMGLKHTSEGNSVGLDPIDPDGLDLNDPDGRPQ